MDGFTICAGGPNRQPTNGTAWGSLYPGDPRGTPHLDAVLDELMVDQRAQLGVNRGKDFGKLLDLRDAQSSCAQGLGHLEADVTCTHDESRVSIPLLEGPHHGKSVTH